MKTIRNTEIKSNEYNEVPKYNNDLAGGFEQSRFSGSINTRDNLLLTVKTIKDTVDFTYSSVTVKKTISHNLGYRPLIDGIYKLRSRGNWRMLGDMANVYHSGGNVNILLGKVWIDDVTPSSLTVGANISNGSGAETIDFYLFLQNHESI